MRTNTAVPACVWKWGLYKKTHFFLYTFQMGCLHFFIEKMVKNIAFWISYINKGLVLYFEYQNRENTTIGE